jgi:hypothetical protein
MATRTVVVLVCDGCGADDEADGNGPVLTHRIGVDGVSWAIDVCGVCWTSTFRDALAPLTRYASRTRIPARPKSSRKLRAVS